jgi:hypothetical protein
MSESASTAWAPSLAPVSEGAIGSTADNGTKVEKLNPDTGKVGMVESKKKRKSRKAKRKNEIKIHKPKNPLRDIVLYLTFLLFYSTYTLRGLTDDNIFFFGENIKGQFAGVEFLEHHSPTMGKTFADIGTVDELYQWMQGPLLFSAFSEHTFDGNYGTMPPGNILGHGKILGAVRISQVRSTKHECNAHVPSVLAENFTWECYGWDDGSFSLGVEDVSDFGMFSEWSTDSHGDVTKVQDYRPFTFNGHLGSTGAKLNTSVAYQRTQYLSGFTTRKWNSYPAPAFQININPSIGKHKSRKILENLVYSNYVDLQTKAVFVDLVVYNPMLDRVCAVKLIAEMTKAGGVMTDVEVDVIKLWPVVTYKDYIYYGILGVVAGFYIWYFYEAYIEWKRVGNKWFSSFLNICQVMNFVFFVMAQSFLFYAQQLVPTSVPVESWEYVEFTPSVRFFMMAQGIRAMNVFLNWFKLIHILSYSPTFGLMTDTLGKAAEGVAGFSIIFFIIFFGFAQAHAMIFNGRLESFRTVGQTMFSLLRSLLGDFDFDELQQAHGYMGPLLFIIFVVLAVFVVLNMLIAIISDAYSETKEKYVNIPKVNLTRELIDYVFGGCMRCIHKPKPVRIVATDSTMADTAKKEGKAEAEKSEVTFVSDEEAEAAKKEAREKRRKEEGEAEEAEGGSILSEWCDSLQANEAEFQRMQVEMDEVNQEVIDLKKDFAMGLEAMMQAVIKASEVATEANDQLYQLQFEHPDVPEAEGTPFLALEQPAL